MTTTLTNLASHFKTITKHLPQAEPILFVQPFAVLPDDEFAARFSGPNQTAVCTPSGFFFQQTFWSGLPKSKQCGLILHEVMHGALGHLSHTWVDRSVPLRTFRQLSNIAMDMVIEHSIWQLNQKIQPNRGEADRDILQIYPPEAFMPYAGLTWRQVYALLLQKLKSSPKGGGEGGLEMYGDEVPGPVCDSQSNKADPKDDGTQSPGGQRWEAAAKEMETIRQRVASQGSAASGQTLEIAPEVPVIPWQNLLVDFLVSAPAKVNKAWSRVKRRPFANRGEYRPVLAGSTHNMPMVNLLLDTSGSMSGDYNAMAGEVLAICAMAQKVHRVDYDVGVAYQEVIEDPEDYTIDRLHGGGGTCIHTTVKQLLEDRDFNRDVPCVVLTDGGDNYDIAHLGLPCVFLTYGSMFTSDAGPVIKVERP